MKVAQASLGGQAMLREIGECLDRDEYPAVHAGGVVKPGTPHRHNDSPGTERMSHGEETAGFRAQTGPRAAGAWPARRSTNARPRKAGASSSVVQQPALAQVAGVDLAGVAAAYPEVRMRHTPDLVWLSLWISPIQGLSDSALMITAYPFSPRRRILSWAWWGNGLWIGERHTNYPDGSICSFEPADGTWARNGGLVTLFDLHTLWIVRHLFLKRFGRWPGRQLLHTPHERITENGPKEFCGCDSGERYESCCRERDLGLNALQRLSEFRQRFGCGIRRPPAELLDFLCGGRTTEPPLDLVAPLMPIGPN